MNYAGEGCLEKVQASQVESSEGLRKRVKVTVKMKRVRHAHRVVNVRFCDVRDG